MKTVRRLLYGETLLAVGFVLLAFLSLFFFFDLVEELPALGRPSRLDPQQVYEWRHALAYVALLLPSRVYELLPIAVLIGAIVVLARMAHSSEFTILRTSGLGPWRALRMLLALGLMFVGLTFWVGDYLAPLADKSAQLLKARFEGRLSVGQTGAWIKERQEGRQYAVNVGALGTDGVLQGVRIYEMDDSGRLLSTRQAARGFVGPDGAWMLQEVLIRRFDREPLGTVEARHLVEERWASGISNEMLGVALLRPDRMRTADLFAYTRHLIANGQSAQRYEIEFWRKVFYPLSCLVMVVLALPFAYLHFRAGGITGYVFLGVMIGISFFLLNNVFGYIGNLNQWRPWLAAASPAIIYSFLSLGAFGWLVLRR